MGATKSLFHKKEEADCNNYPYYSARANSNEGREVSEQTAKVELFS
jgi:hypothetical protein